jgi:hypothetical protein
MGEVYQLFSAARWVAAWEALGGYILVGEGRWGEDGKREVGIAGMMPQLDRRPQPERNRIKVLRRQVGRSAARMEVIDFLARRATTRGE